MLAFCPEVLEGGGDQEMVLCHSVNAGIVVGILRACCNVFEMFALRGGGDAKASSLHLLMPFTPVHTPRTTLRNFHNI